MTTIEVFAEVACPFTHVGLRRFVERRDELGRDDVQLVLRAWPLEIVNGSPLDARFVADEVDEIRRQVAPTLFTGFDPSSFPATSLPALALTAAAYRVDIGTGERVGLAVRDLLFERGVDVSDPTVLAGLAADHDVVVDLDDATDVRAEHTEGLDRDVTGSPHWFTPGGDFFCPSLDIHRDDDGNLQVRADPAAFERFIDDCFD